MSQDKNLFDLFREGSQNHREQPTPRTWKRLERKLDTHQRRSHHRNDWTLAMVAAVIGLVVLVGFITFTIDHSNQNMLADQDAAPRYFEELELSAEEELRAASAKVIEYQRHYKDRANKPIEEGSKDSKLIPAMIADNVPD